MSYERLQVTDHVDKWDVAKLKHVEDGIVANEEAIRMLQGGSQADWGQNDESAVDYVKNRTHYVILNEKIVTNEKVVPYYGKDLQCYAQWRGSSINEFEIDSNISNWLLLIDGIEIPIENIRLEDGPGGLICTWYFNKSGRIKWEGTYWLLTTETYLEGVELDIKLIYKNDNYKTLDENFIPDTIARKNNVVTSINGQNGNVSLTWDNIGSVQEGFDTGFLKEGRCDINCKLTIGNTVYFDIEIRDFRGGVESSYTIPWVIDETYSFSHNFFTASYSDGILTVIPNYDEYRYVRAYAPNAYNIIDEKYLPNAIADWNQNNAENTSYVKNRTHYVIPEVSNVIWDTTTDASQIKQYSVHIFTSKIHRVTINGIAYLVKATIPQNGAIDVYDENQSRVCTLGQYQEAGSKSSYINFPQDGMTRNVIVEAIQSEEIVQPLDEKYIPDTIVRVKDAVTSVNSQTGNVVIDIPVTSVNGQTGDITTVTSWNELENKPFGEKETRELIAEAYDEESGISLYYSPLTCIRAPQANERAIVIINDKTYESVWEETDSGPLRAKINDYSDWDLFYYSDKISQNTFIPLQSIQIFALKNTIDLLDEKYLPDTIARVDKIISAPQIAQIGQTIVVKEIDEDGKPIEWEAVDLPTFKITDFITDYAEGAAGTLYLNTDGTITLQN